MKKSSLKYILYVISVMTACYGFWGCLFPELTLVKGTYQVCGGEEIDNIEQFYAEILGGNVTVTYRCKLWKTIKSRCGFEND